MMKAWICALFVFACSCGFFVQSFARDCRSFAGLQTGIRTSVWRGKSAVPPIIAKASISSLDSPLLASAKTLFEQIKKGKKIYHIELSCDPYNPADFDFAKLVKALPSNSEDAGFIKELSFSYGGIEDAILKAYILPEGVNDWLVKEADKQENALGGKLLFQRMDCASRGREEETWSIMNRSTSRTAIWIGLPGSGKTFATVNMLMRGLESILSGKDDEFKTVYYRMKKKLLKFCLKDGAPVVELVSRFPDASMIDTDDWKAFHPWDDKNKYLFIAEMGEYEKDPTLAGFYTGSSRRAFSVTFKTHYKGGGAFFLYDPPSRDQLRIMYGVLSHVENGRMPQHINTQAKFEDLLADIGPVPRYLFASDHGLVTGYQNARESAVKSINLELATQLDIDNVGEYCKYFLAPFVRPGVKVPKYGNKYSEEAKEYLQKHSEVKRLKDESDTIFKFLPLSEVSSTMLAKAVRTPRELRFLESYGDRSKVLEATIKYAGALKLPGSLHSSIREETELKNWQYCADRGPVVLHLEDVLSQKDPRRPEYELCKVIARFSGSTLKLKVWELKKGTLYCTDNLIGVEWVFVDHDKKIVYTHQVTTVLFKNHPCGLSVLDRILADLGMLDEKGKDYKLCIIGVNDVSLENPTGMAFIDDRVSKEETSLHSLEDLQQAGKWENAKRIQTVIARVKVFDMPEFVLTAERSSFLPPEHLTKAAIKKMTKADRVTYMREILKSPSASDGMSNLRGVKADKLERELIEKHRLYLASAASVAMSTPVPPAGDLSTAAPKGGSKQKGKGSAKKKQGPGTTKK